MMTNLDLTLRHSMPGLIGFVGKKGQPHSNHSSLYLTLSPLSLFDRKYSETARILTTTLPFEKYSSPGCQDKLKIETVTPLFGYQPASLLRKRTLLQKRAPFFKERVGFLDEDAIINFVEECLPEQDRYLSGPKSLSFANIENQATLMSIQTIPLSDVEELCFDGCRLDFDFFRVFFGSGNFMPKIKAISLSNMRLTPQTLHQICQLKLESLSLHKVDLTDSEPVFRFLCFHSGYFGKLKKVSFSLGLSPLDLACLSKDRLTEYFAARASKSKPMVSQSNSKSRSKTRHSSNKKDRSQTSGKQKGSQVVGSGVCSGFNQNGNAFVTYSVDPEKVYEDLVGFGSGLEELDLSGNQIFDEGLEMLLQALPRNILKRVDLEDTGVTSKGGLLFIYL